MLCNGAGPGFNWRGTSSNRTPRRQDPLPAAVTQTESAARAGQMSASAQYAGPGELRWCSDECGSGRNRISTVIVPAG